jgi:protein-tyrosine phosphatase
VIDLHTHILPGIDDGARTLEDALEMARVFVGEGVTAVAATPHVRDDFPTSADVMLRAVDALRRVLDEEEIPLTVLPGAEVAVEWIGRFDETELRRLTLAGSGRYILVETPYHGWPVEVVERLLGLRVAGLTPVLAHPERNPVVQATPSLLAPLVQGGVLVQVTAASLDGRLGKASYDAGHWLVAAGLAQIVASDAHAAHVRAAGMLSAVEAIRDDALAQWLVSDVPRALVQGEGLPPRPLSS